MNLKTIFSLTVAAALSAWFIEYAKHAPMFQAHTQPLFMIMTYLKSFNLLEEGAVTYIISIAGLALLQMMTRFVNEDEIAKKSAVYQTAEGRRMMERKRIASY